MKHQPPSARHTDLRPFLKDAVTGREYLFDTGSQVTAIPPQAGDVPDPSVQLDAVNGTSLRTYGTKEIQIKVGRHTYSYVALKADVSRPILGYDFVKHFRLGIEWDNQDVPLLVDPVRRTRSRLHTKSVPQGSCPSTAGAFALGQAQAKPGKPPTDPPTFRHQVRTAEIHEKALQDVPARYRRILLKYPGSLTHDFKAKTVKHGVVHRIDTTGPPCKASVRRLMQGSPKEQEGRKAWFELLDMGVIKRVPHGTTAWSSALHLQPKPSGGLRPCGDFRNLNSKTALDQYPLPNLRSFAHNLRGATLFSKVDLLKAYHQVPIHPSHQEKTSVKTMWGSFQFCRMPMGLCNAAQTFQKLMDYTLQDLEGLFIYLDDVLIYAKDQEEHDQRLEALLERLQSAGLAIAPEKSVFAVDELDFVGYRLTRQGIKPLAKKVDAIMSFPRPDKAKQLARYLGMLNYYRATLPIIGGRTPAEVLQPLYTAATTKNPKNFKWTRELGEAFQESKQLLVKAASLNLPDPNAPVALTTDASKYAIGGVLEQYVNGDGNLWDFGASTFRLHIRNGRPSGASYTPFIRRCDTSGQTSRADTWLSSQTTFQSSAHSPASASNTSTPAKTSCTRSASSPTTSGIRKGRRTWLLTHSAALLRYQSDQPTYTKRRWRHYSTSPWRR